MMSHKDFQTLQTGERIKVVRMKLTGRKPCLDEETGEQTTRPIMRKCGEDVGTITRRIDSEMVSVHFDSPVPDINRPDVSHSNYSVYFRDVIGRA